MRLAHALAPQGIFGIMASGGTLTRVRRLALAALIAAGLLAVLAQPVTAHRSTAVPHHAAQHSINSPCSGVSLPC